MRLLRDLYDFIIKFIIVVVDFIKDNYIYKKIVGIKK